MKKAIVAIYLTTLASMTWAACTTNTIMSNGRMVTCTTCCYGSNCTTNCF
jgi:predicted small secreted protein